MNHAQTDHLYRRWLGYLLSIAYDRLGDWQMAQDAVQDCFLRLYRKDIVLQNSEDERKYLSRIVRNECIDKVRVSGRMKIEPVESLTNEQTNEQINEQIEWELCRSIVDTLIEKHLNPREKIVMRMYLEGIPPCEIAVKLNRSVNTIMNQKARGLGILKDAVKKFKLMQPQQL